MKPAHVQPTITEQMQRFLALCGGVDYSLVETEFACLRGLPGIEGEAHTSLEKVRTADGSMAPSRGNTTHWSHVETSRFYCNVGTQIQMCMPLSVISCPWGILVGNEQASGL